MFLEQAFLLQYYMGMSYSDVRSLPIQYRVWFINRIVQEKKRANSAANQASTQTPLGQSSSASDQNIAARTRRFT